MRSHSPAMLAYLNARKGFMVRLLFWAEPRNRVTGVPVPIGVWTGSYTRDFTIQGGSRIYAGAGAVLGIAPIVTAIGTEVRTQRVTLSAIFPEIEDIIRLHDARRAPCEIHRACFDPDTLALIEEPRRLFKGRISKAPITRPEDGGLASVQLSLVSSARDLTRTLTAKQSDASQQLRAGDRFLRHADVSGQVDVAWGETRVSTAPVGTPFVPRTPTRN